MQLFVLDGFTHDLGFRVFSFERVGDDRVRTKCSVRADLALARKYGIKIQELPLLCRTLLDRLTAGEELQPLTFTEADMRTWSDDRAAARDAAASKKRSAYRPPAENAGAAWRTQHVDRTP